MKIILKYLEKQSFINKDKGFTLIEILVSITLLSIVVTGSLYVFQSAFFHTTKIQAQTNALNVARNSLMFMEKENFIQTRHLFESNTKETNNFHFFLISCNNQYTITDEVDTSLSNNNSKNCQKIMMDDIEYSIKINAREQITPDKSFYSYYVPIKISVSWEFRGIHSVELEGDIKSEDIR